MIKSIYFPKNGDGYLYTKPEHPGPEPKKEDHLYNDWTWDDGGKRKFNKEKYDRDHERWEVDRKYYEENKGQFTNKAAKYLIGKKFKFEPGKVNIIFGPNGCGKTTILKAIAGNAGIDGDGMTKLVGPIDAFGFGDDKSLDTYKKRYIHELMKNTATVDWDGNVVYYDNFTKTLQNGYGTFGSLVGSALGSVKDEIIFRIDGSKLSSGQKAGWIFNRVAAIQEAGLTLKNITEDRIEKHCNSTWESSYKAQVSYFSELENYDKKVPMTVLFDEPEVNFDIPTVWGLYTQVFPEMSKEFGTQIITVSHSPLVLSESVMGNEFVNIISLDQEYTDKVRTFLGKLSF